MSDADEKRHEATPAKRRRAHREGNVARSAELTSVAAFGAATIAAAVAVPFGASAAIATLREAANHIAAGAFAGDAAWTRFALALPATILRAAVVVAAPAVAVAASLQLVLAAVARVVPRFSSFTLAFPATFAAAVVVTLATLRLIAPLGAQPWIVLPW